MVPFTHLSLSEDWKGLPKSAGVVEFLGPGDKSLLVGRPRNLRRFVASHLGAGPPVPAGKRPPLDLRPVATGLRYRLTGTAFEQRLVYERVMASLVPRSARRDLKEPFYLHLDPQERFPRISIRLGPPKGGSCHGPFRTRALADRALRELHRLYPVRPCDFAFEPSPQLSLGLSCLFAQTRTCAAPCLCRIGEEEYRGLGAEVARFLADATLRSELAWLPPFVGALPGRFGLVLIPEGEHVALFPIRDLTVLVDEARIVETKDLGEVPIGFDLAPEPADDAAWLTEWLYARKREGLLVLGRRPEGLQRAARAHLGEPPGRTVIT